MVQLADFSAPSAWYQTAQKKKKTKAPPSVEMADWQPSPTFSSQLCAGADDSPRGESTRKKRVAFADSQSDSSDHSTDVPHLFSSDTSSVASEEDEVLSVPLWTLASFHAGPFFLNTFFASRG
eukprot:GGOE01032023.1.p1 GENE.GGOE01032023.1~~GGOE01032023.1.p1  ORF type:complete len:131 (-),score=39.91 GGOE01032023.1:746-1114(-)